MKIFLTILLLSSVSYGEIFVIDKDQEFPFNAAQIKKSFKKDISDYLDSTTPVLKRLEGAPFNFGPLPSALW